ncbi:MAG: ABC transporter ATP-binding protein [Propionibacteriaceae bacterium]|jgi:ABC-2 type transport system ATP-binding protein|nr:ABC transporter ATP-binding protein [Propionibacteriaceae bacterium]
MEIIQAKGLSKNYHGRMILDGLSLSINSGEVVALAAPNGAGKTTLLRLILGLAHPTAGLVSTFGNTPGIDHQRINYLCEELAVFPHNSAAGNLQISALSRTRPALDSPSIDTILRAVSLKNSRRSVGRFSLGMKRRLQLAMAVLINPADLIILDEPTNGLDIDGVLWLLALIKDLTTVGATLLMATHSLNDFQGVISRCLVLDRGQIAADFRTIDAEAPLTELYQQALAGSRAGVQS